MTAAAPLRVAVIGCGAVVEQCHAPALAVLAARGEVDVVALCDPAPARLEAIAKRFRRATRTTTLDQVVDVRPDLALIASPPALHASQATALLDAGIHVLCEKPFVPSVADADRVIAAARRSERILAVGLFRRFFSATRVISDAITSGELGALRSAVVTEVGGIDWPFRSTSAFTPELTPGGVLLDTGAHAFDLLAWWFPQIRVVAYEDDAMGGTEATAVATMDVSGAPVSLRLSRDWQIRSRYDLSFEHARIVWDGIDPAAVRVERTSPSRSIPQADVSAFATTWGDAFLLQLTNTVEAIRRHGAPAVGGPDARVSLCLMEECYRIRTLLVSPWFSEPEKSAAIEAAAEGART